LYKKWAALKNKVSLETQESLFAGCSWTKHISHR